MTPEMLISNESTDAQVLYLLEQGCFDKSFSQWHAKLPWFLEKACARGWWNSLCFIYENTPTFFRKALPIRLYLAAAENGHFEWVVWLHTKALKHAPLGDQHLSAVIECVAAQGHLPFLEWLFSIPPEGRVYHPDILRAFNKSAEKGHVHVVRWLIAHHKKLMRNTLYPWAIAIPSHALDMAAKNGHLDVVQALTLVDYGTSKQIKCTCNALKFAQERGHDDIVEWLLQHFPDITKRTLVDDILGL